jgi:hypothetical protein
VKLLLDENLSPQLIEQLSDLYPGSAHVAGRADFASTNGV